MPVSFSVMREVMNSTKPHSSTMAAASSMGLDLKRFKSTAIITTPEP